MVVKSGCNYVLMPILAKKEENGQWQEKAQQYNKE